MTTAVPRDVQLKVQKLARLVEEARQARTAISITRLTSIKALCKERDRANRFVIFLARKALEQVQRARPAASETPVQAAHRQMMIDALAEMDTWAVDPTETHHRALRDLLARMRAAQDEHEPIQWGSVRLIIDRHLLLVEYAAACLLARPDEAPTWAYQAARHYAETYSPSMGTGLTPSSAPPLRDIADFWLREFGLAEGPVRLPVKGGGVEPPPASHRPAEPHSAGAGATFTARQGQFLAFIHLYRKMHRRGPAEADLQKFFRVTPPAVHDMLVKLESLGLITREPGVARSARVVIPESRIPPLADVSGPPW